MTTRLPLPLFVFLISLALWAMPAAAQSQWKAHDITRPKPPVVTPAPADAPDAPPSDAIVLFGGDSLSAWETSEGAAAPWIVRDGYFEVAPGTGPIQTKEGFGDVQLHLEWMSPEGTTGEGQGRNNSGVFLMNLYEVQVLDSYENDTYADGQATAIYGQHPPLANAMRPQGEWQSYDIVFRRPRFGQVGEVVSPARVTVFHNGVLVQDNVELWGIPYWLQFFPYRQHADRLPISLQDHGNPVRFRNIWVRPLDETPPPVPPDDYIEPVVDLPVDVLDRYVGTYRQESGAMYTVGREGDELYVVIYGDRKLPIEPNSETEFSFKHTDASLTFDLGDDGIPETIAFTLAGDVIGRATKVQG